MTEHDHKAELGRVFDSIPADSPLRPRIHRETPKQAGPKSSGKASPPVMVGGSSQDRSPRHRPLPQPDWSHWRILPSVRAWEAAALLANIEPRNILDRDGLPAVRDYPAEMKSRLDVLVRWIEDGTLPVKHMDRTTALSLVVVKNLIACAGNIAPDWVPITFFPKPETRGARGANQKTASGQPKKTTGPKTGKRDAVMNAMIAAVDRGDLTFDALKGMLGKQLDCFNVCKASQTTLDEAKQKAIEELESRASR